MILNITFEDTKITCFEHDRLKAVMNYLEDNLDEQISLKRIAGIACMTEQSFCRYFKKKTGNKFFEYLMRMRMVYAAELLLQQHVDSIYNIAYSCGFKSSSHFCKIFKNHYGESPYRYRANIYRSND